VIRIINKYICGILLLLLTGYFFFTKDMSNCYDKTIMAEGLDIMLIFLQPTSITIIHLVSSIKLFEILLPRLYSAYPQFYQ